MPKRVVTTNPHEMSGRQTTSELSAHSTCREGLGILPPKIQKMYKKVKTGKSERAPQAQIQEDYVYFEGS